MGSQLTKNYDVERTPSSYGGISGPWEIYSATQRTTKQQVSIFMNNKTSPELVNRLKAEATKLTKLRHPSVLQVVEPLLEDAKTLAFVTEPVVYSLSDLLQRPSVLPSVLSDTEIRLGLLDLVQGLLFLHLHARTVHFAVCPDNIYITEDGKWKLGGMMFAEPLGQNQAAQLPYDLNLMARGLAPILEFTAPEVVRDRSGGCSADVFSLGCLVAGVYKVLASPALHCKVMHLREPTQSSYQQACLELENSYQPDYLPQQLREVVLRMFRLDPSQRSSLQELSRCKAFQTPYVKAIFFLEHLHEKQDSQKLGFFKGLSSIIDKFDEVIMTKRLLPALVQNMKDPSLSPFILPNMLRIVKNCQISKTHFQELVWPSIAKLAVGKEIPAQSFYLILGEIDLLMQYSEESQWKKTLMPLVFKGYQCGVSQIQEILMKKTPNMFEKILDKSYLRNQVLPKFLQGILSAKTTTVREEGLKSLSQVFQSFDRSTLLDSILPSLDKLKKLDVTGTMIMHLLHIYKGISKSLGHKVTAVHVLPALCPLLVEAEMTKKQFKTFCETLENMVSEVQKTRTVELPEEIEQPENFEFENSLEPQEDFQVLKDIFEQETPFESKNELEEIFTKEVPHKKPLELAPKPSSMPKEPPKKQELLQFPEKKPISLLDFPEPQQVKKPTFPQKQNIKIDTDDFFEEFLNKKSDPFAGL